MRRNGPLTKIPAAPKALGHEARKLYRDTAAYLVGRGVLHAGDLPSLEMYAVLMCKFRDVEAQLEGEELCSPEAVHAGLKFLPSLVTTIVKLTAQLGLAPTTRSRMPKAVREQDGPPSKEEKDWLALVN